MNSIRHSHLRRHCYSEVLATKPFFIKLLTDEGDIVLDPFGRSYTTGAVAEKLERRWLISETMKEYLDGSKFRFE